MTNIQASLPKMLFEPIFVPIEDNDSEEIALVKLDIGQAEISLGFSSALKLALFCGDQTHFLETSASELFGQLIASQTWFGFDFEDETGDIYDIEALHAFMAHLEKDIEVSDANDMRFQKPQNSEAFLGRLLGFMSEFETKFEIGLVADDSDNVILVLRKEDLQSEYSLLAKAHQFIRSDQERAEIFMMTCETFAALGEDFLANAEIICSPEKIPEPVKPPKLRY